MNWRLTHAAHPAVLVALGVQVPTMHFSCWSVKPSAEAEVAETRRTIIVGIKVSIIAQEKFARQQSETERLR